MDLDKILKLVKLKLDEKEKAEMEIHFRKMIELIEKIEKIEGIDALSPLYNPAEDYQYLVLREDRKRIYPRIVEGYIEAPSPLKDILKSREKRKNGRNN